MTKDSTLKIILVSVLGLIGLWLVKAILFPTGYGVSVRYNMPGYYNNGFEQSFQSNYNSGFNSFALLIFQILLVLFVVALLVGVVMLVKNYVFTSADIETIKRTMSGKTIQVQVRKACAECGNELNPEWRVCPNCGKDVIEKEEIDKEGIDKDEQ